MCVNCEHLKKQLPDADMTAKKRCVTCSKSGGVMICDGCQQAFCGKHSVEHRQELTHQLDGIMQEHDLLQQELGQELVNHSLLKQINKWEKESIKKIRVAAEAARAELREVVDGSRETILRNCRDIAVNLRASREADDFSESDLDRWMKQLQELKLEFNVPSSVTLAEDTDATISLMMIKHKDLPNKKPTEIKRVSLTKTPALSVLQERFSQAFGRAIIEEERTAVRHVGVRKEYVHILGEQLYNQDRQTIRFQIGYENSQYNTFFGCISSDSICNKVDFDLSAAVGWSGRNEIYQHGAMNYKDYDSNQIRTDDILSITFDCDNQQIEFYHERTKKSSKLQVNTKKAPFPWRLMVILYRPNDWVRIIPNE